MKTKKNLLLLAALPLLCGCASFNSGDMLVDRATAQAMLEDKAVTPFSAIELSWKNFPYRAPTDSIGEGSASKPKKLRPVQVDAEDEARLLRQAREIFGKAGLYDRARGRGTLRLELTSFGRWTYGDLWRSFLVDTGFIFILPASLRVNYFLAADFAVPAGPLRVETEARNKTTFHLFMAPLYPFLSPGSREKGLLRQMLWRSATDVYAKLKAAGGAPAPLAPKTDPAEKAQPLSGPPVEPDRTWLPGRTPQGEAPVLPDKPDQTWTVPAQQAEPAADPEKPVIQPAKPDQSWNVTPAQPAPAPAPAAAPAAAPAQAPAEDEPQDD